MQKIYARLSGVNIPLTFVTTMMVVCFLSFIFMNPEMVDEFAAFWNRLIANYFAGYLIWVVALVTIFTLLIAFTPYGNLRQEEIMKDLNSVDSLGSQCCSEPVLEPVCFLV